LWKFRYRTHHKHCSNICASITGRFFISVFGDSVQWGLNNLFRKTTFLEKQKYFKKASIKLALDFKHSVVHTDPHYRGVKRFTTEQQWRVEKKVIHVLESAILHFTGREYSVVSSA